MINYHIREGYVEPVSTKSQGPKTGFNLTSWLKKMLTRFNVQFYDNCCDEASDYQTLRYKKSTGTFETFDGVNWIDVTP